MDRSGRGDCRGDRPRYRTPRNSSGIGAGLPLVHFTAVSLVDEPATNSTRPTIDRSTTAVSPCTLPEDLEVLRTLRGCGRQLAAAGQLSGEACGPDQSPNFADEYGPGLACKPGGL